MSELLNITTLMPLKNSDKYFKYKTHNLAELYYTVSKMLQNTTEICKSKKKNSLPIKSI